MISIGQMQAMYDRIDLAAHQLVSEAKGRGHAAAPLHRFKLDPLRQKRPPPDVELWMLQDGIMPDDSVLPVRKRLQIGRPRGRKNKVNASRSPSVSMTMSADGSQAAVLMTKQSSVKVNDHPHDSGEAEDHSAPLTIVALPSPDTSMIDPAMDLQPTEGSENPQDSSGLELAHLALNHAHTGILGPNLNDAQYSTGWHNPPEPGVIELATEEISGHRDGEMAETGGGVDARSQLQDYLMRFSNVVG
jgi:hypothetical protein